jgi:BASS family bile acid:Na+ symporter
VIPEQILQFTYNFSLAAALWATAIAIGLRLTVGQIASSFARTSLMIKALLLNLAIIPLGVLILTRILPVEPGVAIGLLLLAAAAGGPLGLTATQLARGDTAFALTLISVLQVTRVVAIPFWLGVFLPFGLAEFFQTIATLVWYILLPLAAGMTLRKLWRDRSAGWSRMVQRVGSALIVVVSASGLLLYRETLAALVVSWTMLLILAIQLLSLGLGYVFGGPETASRSAVAVTAVMRSSAVALIIANQVYPERPPVVATVIAYGVMALVVATSAAVGMARQRCTAGATMS